MNCAIIPARGGSKRIPRKNVREFCGRPMIEWSIRTAIDSGLFSRIIVSTDDPEISEAALKAGAEVPFVRPPEISDDTTPTIQVIRHALDWLESENAVPEFVCCLYATAPFLRPAFLQKSLEQLRSDSETAFLVSATEYAFPIFRALKTDPEGRVSMFWPEHNLTRSQDLPPAFHDAGQFYWGTPTAFREHEGFFNAPCRLFLLPPHRVLDIDSPQDWEKAEIAFEIMNRLPADD
ncbi:MAG: pseudaminic acid cytidylyltransferase [Puniceicoccaceae bacterium]